MKRETVMKRIVISLLLTFLLGALPALTPPSPQIGNVAIAQTVNPDLVAPDCGRFTPFVVAGNHGTSFAHLYAKDCNKILIGDVIETIPSGTGVLAGGVSMQGDNTYIGKVPGQAMQVGVVYYAFAWCASYTPDCNMVINLEPQTPGPNQPPEYGGLVTYSTGHMESPDYGHEIAVVGGVPDRTQTLVGMVRLMLNGLIAANAGQQPVTSWKSAGHTALVFNLGQGNPTLKVCREWTGSGWAQRNFMVATTTIPELNWTAGQEIPGYPLPALEWLSFGINAQFTQAYTVPNVELDAIVNVDQPGATVEAYLVDKYGNNQADPIGYYTHSATNPAGKLSAVAAGREPISEGYGTYGLRLKVTAPFSDTPCATIWQGAIHTELWS